MKTKFPMALKLFYLLLIVNCVCLVKASKAQNSIALPAIVYNEKLDSVVFTTITANKSLTIFTSQNYCKACVEYLVATNTANTFVFYVNSLSLFEILSIKSHFKQFSSKPASFYYIIRTKLPKLLQAENKSPYAISTSNNISKLITYTELDKLTDGFTLSKKKLSKKMKAL